MADAEKKSPIVVTPNELAALYVQLREREWDTKAFKNPTTVIRSVLDYGRVAALRLVDVFHKLDKHETRIEALEKFKLDVEEQAAAAMEQMKAMLTPAPAVVPEVAPIEAVPTKPVSDDANGAVVNINTAKKPVEKAPTQG